METMEILELFEETVSKQGSDLHLLEGNYPVLRIDGVLTPLTNYHKLTQKNIEDLLFPILSASQKESLTTNKSVDFSYGYGGGKYGEKGRFRVNLYYQKGTLAGAFRLLPPRIRTIDELSLPSICHTFAMLKQGFILVTGPTGHGKSTTLAAIIDEINTSRAASIVTIEDPIEYVYPRAKSIVSQRELGIDTYSWSEALRSVLREDPDVVLIGEMRDPESVASAVTIAETGHLVLSTLHTNSASQTIDRIIDSFPEHQQNQIRIQLASTLEGIISQRLVPKIDGGRTVAAEIVLGTTAVKSNIREKKTHLIDSIVETSQDVGMMSLETSLSQLVKEGIITLQTARMYALREKELLRLIS